MSQPVVDLAATLRRPTASRIVQGRVVQVVDAHHVRVDLGDKTVVAYTPTAAPLGSDVRLSLSGGVVEVSAVATLPWSPLALAGSWVYYGIGSAMAQPGHRLVGDEVALRGVIKDGTGLIGTLPEGRRPLGGAETFVVAAGPGAARVQVTWMGTVTILGYVGGGTNAEVNLGGVRFAVA